VVADPFTGGLVNVIAPALYETLYATCVQFSDLPEIPEIPEVPAPTTALGIASVPSLLGSAQTTVQVTIRPTLPNNTYNVAAALSGAVNLLASLSVLSISKVSGSRADVVVRNTGLLTLAGALVVVNAVMPEA
jgi:hypothetical protein